MHDQRIVGRAPFGGIDLAGRIGVQRIPAQAVHGLCRKCYQPSPADDLPRFIDQVLVDALRHICVYCLQFSLPLFFELYYSTLHNS